MTDIVNATGDPETLKSLQRIKSAAAWFYIIAALSVINAAAYLLFDSDLSFVVGLGMTQVVSGIASYLGDSYIPIAMLITLFIAGVFVLFGIFARKAKTWAFIIGLVIYVLDALLFFVVRDWLSILFHAFAAYFIVLGSLACHKLNKARKAPVLMN
jgi:hypothetical protein